jgi:hypothetical protein
MIGKITTGKGAGGTISYVCEKDGAQILSSSWGGAQETWASQMHEHGEALNPSLAAHGQSVVHISLSADPKDGKLSDDQWRAISEEYLSRMGWEGHDHAVVRHTDTNHDHIHLIVSRVGRDGQTADLHNDYPRQERVLDSIEKDFNLTRTHEHIKLEAERDPFRAVESATRNNLTFTRDKIERHFERLGFDKDKIHNLTERAIRDERTLRSGAEGTEFRYTTVEAAREVMQIDSALRKLNEQEPKPLLNRGEGAREGLNDGQRLAADWVASGRGLVTITGFAGTGKTTLLNAVHDDLKFSGHDVLGVAPSGKAAKGLQNETGIHSMTLKGMTNALDRGDLKITRNTVVIMDEAGMARNDEMVKLTSALAQAGGRLVLVGDDKQLGAVGRGGSFSHAQALTSAKATLSEVHRQRIGWQREASQAFGEGRAGQAIQSYIDNGRVEWAASRGTARDMLVQGYMKELDKGTKPEHMLAMAHENRDVKAINAAIRDQIKERGGLAGERTYKLTDENGKVQKIALAAGDRVVFEKNNARTGERNGEFGTVQKTDRHGFDVKMDDGRVQRVQGGGKHQMSHGYASTIHKSQGATIDKTFVLASRGMDSKLTYVGLSRQREDTKLYANYAEHKNENYLKNSLGRDSGAAEFRAVLGGEGKSYGATLQEGERWREVPERAPLAAALGGLLVEQGKARAFEGSHGKDKQTSGAQQAQRAGERMGSRRQGKVEGQGKGKQEKAQGKTAGKSESKSKGWGL